MARRVKGWSAFNTEEKLQALHEDVNTALDLVEVLSRRAEAIESLLKRTAARPPLQG